MTMLEALLKGFTWFKLQKHALHQGDPASASALAAAAGDGRSASSLANALAPPEPRATRRMQHPNEKLLQLVETVLQH